MLRPIHKDHEQICPGCGCVLSTVNESFEDNEKRIISTPLDIFVLGTAVQNGVFRNPQQVFEDKVLRNLIHLVKKYNLPDRFVIETFYELKRKKRGFRSENAYIKQLLEILSRDENYIHIHKYRLIKARYESIINH